MITIHQLWADHYYVVGGVVISLLCILRFCGRSRFKVAPTANGDCMIDCEKKTLRKGPTYPFSSRSDLVIETAKYLPFSSSEIFDDWLPADVTSHPDIAMNVLDDVERNGGQNSNVEYLSTTTIECPTQSQVPLNETENNSSSYPNQAQNLNTKQVTTSRRSPVRRMTTNAWLEEVPTMVIGLSTTSGSVNNEKMTVVGTVCLDNIGLTLFQELRVQEKGPFIAETTMIEIVQVLATTYCAQIEGRIPERVVVYRLGGDDGMFEDMIGKEVPAIKKAFYELNICMRALSCAHCEGRGCVNCLPKITMVSVQQESNLNLATRNPGNANMEGLLPTHPDGQAHAAPHQCISLEGKSNAFAVVAPGVFEGTSKCILYECIWNESLLFSPKSPVAVTPLTLSELEKLTCFLSSKSGMPRLPALLEYSSARPVVSMD